MTLRPIRFAFLFPPAARQESGRTPTLATWIAHVTTRELDGGNFAPVPPERAS